MCKPVSWFELCGEMQPRMLWGGKELKMTNTRVEANQHGVITAERMVWPIESGLSEPQSDSNSHILRFLWNDLPWISGLVVILHEEICKVTSFSKARGVTVWPNGTIIYRLPRVYVREKCITLGKVADVMECILKCSAVDGMWIYCWFTRLNMFLINHKLPQLLS